MTHRIKMYKTYSKPLLESFIQFPPTVNSKFCTEPNPDVMCESVDWSIKVGAGSFIVEIIIGDPSHASKVDIKVNGEYIASNKTIPKGKLHTFKMKVEAVNKFLILNTECEKNCAFSKGKLNTVKITPVIEIDDARDKKKQGHFSTQSNDGFCGGRRSDSNN